MLKEISTELKKLIEEKGIGLAIVQLANKLDEKFFSSLTLEEWQEIYRYASCGTEIEKKAMDGINAITKDPTKTFTLFAKAGKDMRYFFAGSDFGDSWS